ncbi:PGAP2-interacting protein-like [Sycon ciliatum]|uniref:PGAP2-interacting protein-like n=1 Tax=Sycon ciliatum TaxID=27933 RepID=UPI0031F6901E
MSDRGEIRHRRGRPADAVTEPAKGLTAEDAAEPSLTGIVVEGILGFLLWSSVWQIAPCLWLVPLDAMGVTGWEAAVVFWVAVSSLLGVTCLQKALGSPFGVFILRCVGLACSFGSYPFLPAEAKIPRYLLLVVGTTFLFMAWFLQYWGLAGKKESQRSAMMNGFVVGIFVNLAVRSWFRSLHPVFVYDEWGYAALIVGAVCSLQRLVALWGQSYHWKKPTMYAGPGATVSGMTLGLLIFLTGFLFGDSSVLSRWVGTGYPQPGPSPNPCGVSVILALGFGVLCLPCIANRFVWWLLGAAGAATMYYIPGDVGYVGGLFFAVYLGSLYPQVLRRAVQHPIGRTAVIMSLTFVMSVVLLVWATAYNFVPGGELTRERTHFILLGAIVVLGFATCVYGESVTSAKDAEDKSAVRAELLQKKHLNKKAMLIVLMLMAVGIAGIAVRYQAYKPQENEPKSNEFTAAIWTVHFGIDNYGRNSFDNMANLINASGADVIGLLETDAAKPFLANYDMAMYLSEVLNMYTDYGPGPRHHTWGCLLLSRFPIIRSQHLLLPSPHGEIAPAIHATLLIDGKHVDVMVVHMGVDSDDLDRKLQAQTLANVLKSIPNPVFFLGYITCKPGGRDYTQISRDGNMTDIDATEMERWCEYVFYRGLIRQGFARITHGSLTDTEMQVAKFRVKSSATEPDNNQIVYGVDKVPMHLRFPARFGERRQGHHYARFFLDHVFHMNTPRYFVRS